MTRAVGLYGTDHFSKAPPEVKSRTKVQKICCHGSRRYDNMTDPFGRGHSVLAWNRELKKHIGVGPYDNGCVLELHPGCGQRGCAGLGV